MSRDVSRVNTGCNAAHALAVCAPISCKEGPLVAAYACGDMPASTNDTRGDIARPQITSPIGGAHHWKGADDHGRTTAEPRAWQARTRRADAEVDGALAPSTVTTSGPLRGRADTPRLSPCEQVPGSH
jgi:hypothetical protein